jgi:hypothetical protein
VREPGLHPSAEVGAAEWIGPRLRPFGSAVAAVVPDGFAAYVRILHPARGVQDEPVSWADIAASSGRYVHKLVQFHAITRPSVWARPAPPPWSGAEPAQGNLPADLLDILRTTLNEHTGTADACWFCLWDGYGWLHGSAGAWTVSSGPEDGLPAPPPQVIPPALPPEVLHGPRVRLPNRDYLLFKGPLNAVSELGWTGPDGSFVPQSPNLFWPKDHAWCVASEIDLFCTLVAGSRSLAEALVADPRLETWPVDPGDPIAFDSDNVNR